MPPVFAGERPLGFWNVGIDRWHIGRYAARFFSLAGISALYYKTLNGLNSPSSTGKISVRPMKGGPALAFAAFFAGSRSSDSAVAILVT